MDPIDGVVAPTMGTGMGTTTAGVGTGTGTAAAAAAATVDEEREGALERFGCDPVTDSPLSAVAPAMVALSMGLKVSDDEDDLNELDRSPGNSRDLPLSSGTRGRVVLSAAFFLMVVKWSRLLLLFSSSSESLESLEDESSPSFFAGGGRVNADGVMLGVAAAAAAEEAGRGVATTYWLAVSSSVEDIAREREGRGEREPERENSLL